MIKKLLSILVIIFVFTSINNGQSIRSNDTNNKNIATTKTEWSAVSERVFTTAIVVSELALLLGILYYWKKTRIESKATNKNTFKKNIQALRLERIKYFENEKLSSKRRMLFSKINKKIIDGSFITAKAKRLSVSKGEIFLAARIKQLQTKT